MDLTIYDIIKGQRITEKAYRLNKELKKLVLDIHPHANKPWVAEALKKLFNVEAEKIAIVVSKGKNKRIGRHKFRSNNGKKAIVTLRQGYSVDMMDLQNTEIQEDIGSQVDRE
ncbi:50S ribosomal protein L23 [Candidatus Babela massiliensis]|uniref:Large ribosomal subunit protein uL23 n=1 Tax=Candidatus Babela massiliensis TaxID=673862 RepID=V6DJ25_9BACT|nr:50S ribosomal protein L23 [Candidatus Babela massiliensis]CDK30511.1 Ribosomal protein L23 [Candidatus Babela massiliensis]